MEEDSMIVPPGFQFEPTDEELILHFLYRKEACLPCYPDVIPELGPYSYYPWNLNGKALSSGNKWYFFTQNAESLVIENGYWKDLCIEEPIFTSSGKEVGIKKYLVFYFCEVPTNWILQEYRLCNFGESSTWVLCKLHQRNGNPQESFYCHGDDDDERAELSSLDEAFMSFDDELDEMDPFC